MPTWGKDGGSPDEDRGLDGLKGQYRIFSNVGCKVIKWLCEALVGLFHVAWRDISSGPYLLISSSFYAFIDKATCAY